MRRHCAIFLPSLRDGGVQRVLIQVARGLAKTGIRTTILVPNLEGPMLKQVPRDNEGVDIVSLGANTVSGAIVGLLNWLRSNRPQAALSGMKHGNIALIMASKVVSPQTRIVVSEHTPLSASNQKTRSTSKERLLLSLIPYFYNRSNAVVAVSHGIRDDLIHLGVDKPKVSVIPNPVVSPEIGVLAKARTGHPWLDVKDLPVLLGVGRLSAEKDFETLVRAFVELRSTVKARLIILGEGPQRQLLENLRDKLGVTDYVDFPGFVPNPYSYMAKANALAVTSRWEGFGNVIVESLAVGTPVVSTDCPHGPREILLDGQFGELVPIGNPSAVAQAIHKILLNKTYSPDELKQHSARYTLDRIIPDYIRTLGF